MENKPKAFTENIPKGLIRIFLNVESISCQVENDAPDFIDPAEDKPRVKIMPQTDLVHLTNVFERTYPVTLDERRSKEELLVWQMDEKGVWFDIDMDNVKEVWLSEFDFYLESEKPRYLSYFIREVEHKVQWLQKGKDKGEITSLSEFKKQFKPNPVTGKNKFDGMEVIKCADMLGRAIKKIDMRTETALVKFNTAKGRLEPLIIGMAEKLGYQIEALDKETIRRQDEKGNSVSHMISLK